MIISIDRIFFEGIESSLSNTQSRASNPSLTGTLLNKSELSGPAGKALVQLQNLITDSLNSKVEELKSQWIQKMKEQEDLILSKIATINPTSLVITDETKNSDITSNQLNSNFNLTGPINSSLLNNKTQNAYNNKK